MTKLKADCTPEEWAEIRRRARARDAVERQKPGRREYMRDYLKDYVLSPTYREKDNARYSPARRAQQVAAFRKRQYGIDDSAVNALREVQMNACAVCFKPFETETHKGECVDHDHETGRVRGLLCRMCNTLEGYLRRRGLAPTEYGARLAAYLAHPPASQLATGMTH